MNAIGIEHLPVAELPAAWRAKLTGAAVGATVTVSIEDETQVASPAEELWPTTPTPAFGATTRTC